MSEQQAKNVCQYCGYPIDIGEHDWDLHPKGEGTESMPGAVIPSELSTEKVGQIKEFAKWYLIDSKEYKPDRFDRTIARLLNFGLIAATVAVSAWTQKGVNDMFKHQQEQQGGEVNRVIHRPASEHPQFSEPTGGMSHLDSVLAIVKQAQSEKTEPSAELPYEIRDFEARHADDFSYLRSVYGDDDIVELFTYLEYYAKNNSKSEVEAPSAVVVEGFEQMGINDLALRRTIDQIYPRGWTQSAVDTIRFKVQTPEPAKEMKPGWYEMAVTRGSGNNLSKVTIYSTIGESVSYLLETLDHEMAHANDWITTGTASPEDRLKLFRAVTERYVSGHNSYHSNYVEAIDQGDQVQTIKRRVIEYWAEICREYSSEPVAFSQNHPEDFQVVDWWFKKYDPNFDPMQVATTRREMILQMEMDRNEGRQHQGGSVIAARPSDTR